ncbi:MAG TPA: helix-turn-helix transcriptional regulator [Syntrophales bacterium]|nr:helix-turn-helix transcriptional regulator [Smithellaceae bacterium]HOH27877.1 helix-turn-helix transcriptional regulator [Syntrophorhabdus sp.]HPN07906.1 helix-turn-helix transcriptional regulator [Syntrophales bacterium]HQB35660.1 helix-turn-helix transcriptional regulator [Syntrophorhabdus sp.]
MQAHTKKPHTETIELRFIGPIANMASAIDALKPLGFVDTSDSIPWRELFPEYKDEDLPGVCLRGGRYREGMTQKQLADMIGIPQRHISEMENGKRPIGKEMAKRLGKALNIGYKVFL